MDQDEQDRIECYRTAYWLDQGFAIAQAREMAEFSYYDHLMHLPPQPPRPHQ